MTNTLLQTGESILANLLISILQNGVIVPLANGQSIHLKGALIQAGETAAVQGLEAATQQAV